MPPPPVFIEVKTEPNHPPKFIEARTEPMFTPRDPVIESGQWPKTEPLGDIDYEDHTSPVAEVVRVVRMAKPAIIPARTIITTTPPAPLPVVPRQRAQSPQTIIPIPRLPRLDDHSRQTFEPVVRTRFPKATPPALQSRPSQNQNAFIPPPPPVRPAEDDKTSPGIALPPPASMIALPRIPSLKRAR